MIDRWRQRARHFKREDELVILPLGVLAVRALIPPNVLAECRDRARQLEGKPRNWLAAAVIVIVWIALAVAGGYWLAG